MHLIVVSPFPPAITGIGQYGYHVTRALAESGLFARITVLAGAAKNTDHPKHLGLTEIEYCWESGQFNARQNILSRVRRLNPDLIWFNLGASVFGKSALLNLSGLSTPKLTSQLYPTIVTLHELVEFSDLRALNAPGGPFAKWGARIITNISASADVVCLTMHRYADQLSTRGVECFHIPIGAYHQPEILDESESQELLFFTTLAPYKGLELLLNVFQSLRAKYSQLHLTIAGTEHVRFPEYARNLKRCFNGIQGVQWLGQVAEDDIKELFRRAQVVVLPYAASTGSSSVLYQAATWGRPVVVSNLNEMFSIVKENDLEVEFFENHGVESLRNAIESLLDSRAKRDKQTRHNFNSMRRVRPEETTRRYIEAFNRAFEKRQIAKHIPILPASN
jgi:glycosyltransferase involved in cell wall biosynthesis